MDHNVAVGIDLGTTYSCMAFYQNNLQKVVVIPNELGVNTTPSYVSIDVDGHITVGRAAKVNPAVDPLNTVYDIKRLIGRRFTDPVLQEDIKLWPFKVVEEDNVPKVLLNGESYHPEQISAKILAHLKKIAEDYLRCPVNHAVVTVPAYFNDGQRQATKDAGTIAGLEVLRLLNEPTAAAIAHCHQQEISEETKQNILVFDLGGGTLDIAVLTVDGRHISIKAVGGDTHLGGEDFDNSLADFCIQEFEQKHSINLASGKDSFSTEVKTKAAKFLKRLKNQCEEAKIILTAARRTVLSLDAVWGELDLAVQITRDKFNALNQDHFNKCIEIVHKVVLDSGLEKSSINEIILAGGSSRIPKVQEMISEYFDGKKLSKKINGDEAVAYGAAIQAALMTYTEEMLSKADESMLITIQDVVPLPIGIEAYRKGTRTKYFDIIIDKNTPVPCSGTKTFVTTHVGHQPMIAIFEGENEDPQGNHYLGKFQTKNLPASCPKGEHINITMTVNVEGILTVTASYDSSDKTDEITMDEFKGRLTPQQVTSFRSMESGAKSREF